MLTNLIRPIVQKSHKHRYSILRLIGILVTLVMVIALGGCIVIERGTTPTPEEQTPATSESTPGGFTPTAPESEKKIELSGEAIVTNTFKTDYDEYTPEDSNYVIWIVEVTTTNRSFEDELTSNFMCWDLVINNEVEISPEALVLGYDPPEFDLSKGETGTTGFIFIVPATADEANVRLAYHLPLGEYYFGDMAIAKRAGFIYFNETGMLIEEEPMELSGTVTIADKIEAGMWEYTPEVATDVFWIVDISVDNHYLEDEITSNFLYWDIIAGDTAYSAKLAAGASVKDMAVSKGQSGNTRLFFIVPATMSIDDAKLSYQQAIGAYFFGKLSGGQKVGTFEWPE